MGREILIKQMKRIGTPFTVIGAGILFIGIFFIFIFIMGLVVGYEWDNDIIGEVISGAVLMAVGIFMMYAGFTYPDLKKSLMIRLHPEILELVDDLYSNKVFENDDIIVSQKAIASKARLTSIVNREDVLLVYESNERYNNEYGKYAYVRAFFKQQLIFMTSYRKVQMVIFYKKIEKRDIQEFCPNAKVRYSKENMRYVRKKRWAERTKRWAERTKKFRAGA